MHGLPAAVQRSPRRTCVSNRRHGKRHVGAAYYLLRARDYLINSNLVVPVNTTRLSHISTQIAVCGLASSSIDYSTVEPRAMFAHVCPKEFISELHHPTVIWLGDTAARRQSCPQREKVGMGLRTYRTNGSLLA